MIAQSSLGMYETCERRGKMHDGVSQIAKKLRSARSRQSRESLISAARTISSVPLLLRDHHVIPPSPHRHHPGRLAWSLKNARAVPRRCLVIHASCACRWRFVIVIINWRRYSMMVWKLLKFIWRSRIPGSPRITNYWNTARPNRNNTFVDTLQFFRASVSFWYICLV